MGLFLLLLLSTVSSSSAVDEGLGVGDQSGVVSVTYENGDYKVIFVFVSILNNRV